MTDNSVDRVTLDPEDWEEFRALAHTMIDDTLDYLRDVRESPAWQAMPPEVRNSFDEPLPLEGAGVARAYRDFRDRVRSYTNGNIHPRFWGWVQGSGTPLAMMAEMLGAAINPHMAGFNQAPALVEKQVVRWIAEMMGFPREASGIMVTGGSLANMLGLAVARQAKCGLRPFAADDRSLLQAISQGQFTINGFRNRDLQALLYATSTASEQESRRRSAAVSRKLRLLRAHHLIRKVSSSYRYQLTPLGRQIITAVLAAGNAPINSFMAKAA